MKKRDTTDRIMTVRQNRVNKVHAQMNDMFLELHKIAVSDPASRRARQKVLVGIQRLRRDLDSLGLRHRAG